MLDTHESSIGVACPPHTVPFLAPSAASLPYSLAESFPFYRQNNNLLSSLSAKTSQLKHITLDIYDNARAQDTLDNTTDVFSSMSDGIRGSAGRLGRMARQVRHPKFVLLHKYAVLILTTYIGR